MARPACCRSSWKRTMMPGSSARAPSFTRPSRGSMCLSQVRTAFARVALAGVRCRVGGDPLLEEVAEHDPGGPVGAQHTVAGADYLERPVAVGDRVGTRPVE